MLPEIKNKEDLKQAQIYLKRLNQNLNGLKYDIENLIPEAKRKTAEKQELYYKCSKEIKEVEKKIKQYKIKE